MAKFLSHAVRCMFARYSHDVRGLILSNQGDRLPDDRAALQAKACRFRRSCPTPKT
jgi:hypothetical protein